MAMRNILLTAILILTSNAAVIEAFHCPLPTTARQHYKHLPGNNDILPPTALLSSTDSSQAPSSSVVASEAAKLKAEAERIRLEAEKLDAALTKSKIETLEKKLKNKTWIAKHPEEEATLQKELETLSKKAMGSAMMEQEEVLVPEEKVPVAAIATSEVLMENDEEVGLEKEIPEPLQATVIASREEKEGATSSSHAEGKQKEQDATITTATATTTTAAATTTTTTTTTAYNNDLPMAGFDDDDLQLYLPVAREIEETMSNATLRQQIMAFQASEELQDHFQKKIQTMLVQPMQDVMQLENLKKDYLYSTSSREKERLKQEIANLEQRMEEDGPFMYSDSVYSNLTPLSEEEVQLRLQAVGELPKVLQAIYKTRIGLDENADLRLAIEFDYYEQQVQLLEQVRNLTPLTEETRQQSIQGFESLPKSVQDHVAKGLGITSDDYTVDMVINKLADKGRGMNIDTYSDDDDDEENWMSISDVVKVASSSSKGGMSTNTAEYNDIEFVDRSRYMDEFIPSLSRLELIHPKPSDIDRFLAEVVSDKKTFMVTSKPERVIGGYYIRGENKLVSINEDDNNNNKDSPNDAFVQHLKSKLEQSSYLKDKLDFFYIQDPSPPTDEEIDMGETDRPVLTVTTKNREELYRGLEPSLKFAVSSLGIISTFLYALGVCDLQPNFQDRIDALSPAQIPQELLDSTLPIAVPILLIQMLHELAHRVFAWKDKFDVGLPNFVPSIQLGLQGAITPLRSPPPSLKSLFDFSMAGPLVGLIASIFFLEEGLALTSSMDPVDVAQLPALPLYVLKSSSLGGGMIEYFLGKGSLSATVASADAVLPLHPFAIAGFVGAISNALALLPLGHTDGGRISIAMFGRRGAFLVKTFTALILCGMGIFGFDESRILLLYVLYASIWQRGLETPMLNESDELDFGRGVVAILSAILVLLVLVPL